MPETALKIINEFSKSVTSRVVVAGSCNCYIAF
jgi:hypothetical protein